MGLHEVFTRPQEPHRALENIRLYAANVEVFLQFMGHLHPFLQACRSKTEGEFEVIGTFKQTERIHHVDLEVQAVRQSSEGQLIYSSTLTLHLQLDAGDNIISVAY